MQSHYLAGYTDKTNKIVISVFINYRECVSVIAREVFQLFKMKTTEEIENIMKAILPLFYSSVKQKPLPGSYDITPNNPVRTFGHFTNVFFRGLYIDVTFMTAEKWVVPDPILYELLSLPQVADNEELPFSGIQLILCLLAFKLNSYATIRWEMKMAWLKC